MLNEIIIHNLLEVKEQLMEVILSCFVMSIKSIINLCEKYNNIQNIIINNKNTYSSVFPCLTTLWAVLIPIPFGESR